MTYAPQQVDGGTVANVPTEMPGRTEAMRVRIRRPGKRPLAFSGTELVMAMSFTPDLPYWYEINIYRTTEQRFALTIKMFYQSEDETDTAKGWMFETLPEVFDAIEAYDPASDVQVDMANLPKGSAAEMASWAMETRARVSAARANYGSLVGELFEELERVGAYAG